MQSWNVRTNASKCRKKCIANVSIYDDAVIGDHVTIHAGTVLGGSAFYYKKRPEGYDQLLTGGRVIIEDHVDIGAACTIDKGVTGDTTIKEGSKIYYDKHAGHSIEIDKVIYKVIQLQDVVIVLWED